MRFAPRQEERAPQPALADGERTRRAGVESVASQFLATGAGHLQGLAALGVTAPGRVGAVVDAAKGSIDTAVQRNRDGVTERLAQVTAQANADAVAARKHVNVNYAVAVKSIKKASDTASARVDAAHKKARTKLHDRRDKQLARIEKLYADGDKAIRATGVTVGDEAVAYGRKRHDDYLSKRNGESSLLDGPLHDNKMEASADAAAKVADEYRKGLVAEADAQADKAKEGRAKDLQGVGEEVKQSTDVLDAQYANAKRTLGAMERKALRTARPDPQEAAALDRRRPAADPRTPCRSRRRPS